MHNKKVLAIFLMLLSIVIGSYIVLSGTVDNVQDVTPKSSKREVNSGTQRLTSAIDLRKKEIHLKIDQKEKIGQEEKIKQEEKIEVDVMKAEKEENTKKSLKPHHLYVKNLEEMNKEMKVKLLKRALQRDQEKRLKIYREKHSSKSEQ